MARKRTGYLTLYRNPDEAPPLDRLRVRLACRLILISHEVRCDLLGDFFPLARSLVFWSRTVLEELARAGVASCVGDFAVEGKDGCLEADSGLEGGASLAERAASEVLSQRPALRTRWVRETLEWIDSASPRPPVDIERNIDFLADSLGLTKADKALAMCIGLGREDARLLGVMRGVSCGTPRVAARGLSAVLEVPFDEMLQALQPHGNLARLGMACLDSYADLEDIVRASNGRIYSRLYEAFPDAHEFLASFLKPAAAVRIDAEDVAHLGTQFDVARCLIRQALDSRESGVHVLLYGEPGSGKTEFARLIGRELKVQLFEADYEKEDGDSASAQERLSALLLASRALARRQDAFILFDEAEDVFPPDFGRMYGSQSPDKSYAKAWMNRLLETLPVPVIWITNHIGSIDQAYLRRFLLHIRFPELPTAAKQRLTARYLGDLPVGNDFKAEIARLPGLTPAHLESASRLARLCKPKLADAAEDLVRMQIKGSREAIGLDYALTERDTPLDYRSEHVNLREPMSVPVLLQGLRTHRRAAVCFHGEPGTGKTELAHYISRELGRELVYKTASDLLSPWVGATEQNIAEMFTRAESRRDDVVVLLDEADTFLRDRRMALASWEASQTNEFLARMERFSGIFICTTNLVDALDPAVLRRFLFRVEFLALQPEQCMQMFRATFRREPTESDTRALGRIEGLVPADFANVARQMRFMGTGCQLAPVVLLADELRARRGSAAPRQSIGFTA